MIDDAVQCDGVCEDETNDTDSAFSSCILDMPEEEFWNELKLISWCSVIFDTPVRGLPWSQSNN